MSDSNITAKEHQVVEIMGLIRRDIPLNWLFDIDDTLYTSDQYREVGTERELCEIAAELEMDYTTAKMHISAKRQEIENTMGRKSTLTETVYALGITCERWSELRHRAWRPKEFLAPDSELCAIMHRIIGATPECRIAFGTNAPKLVGREVLRVLGIAESFPVFGPESFGISKPDPNFFLCIAASFNTQPQHWISIGNRKMSDAEPAIVAGFCAAIVIRDRDELIEFLEKLFPKI